jgi:hypothetical protein
MLSAQFNIFYICDRPWQKKANSTMINQEAFTSDKDDMATTVMPNSTTANDLGND